MLNLMQPEFLSIRIDSLHPDRPLTFDLYIQLNDKKVLYVRSGDKVSLTKLHRLQSKSSTTSFFILKIDKPAYKAFINAQMNDQSLDQKVRAQILRESSMLLVEELYTHPDVDRALEESKSTIRHFIQFMGTSQDAMADLIGLSGHDFYTYQHSLDVAIYALGLGSLLGFRGEDLEELGRGALFHDIGKRNISLDILCKQGALTDEEWSMMQRHPEFGLRILDSSPAVSDTIKASCFEHHESMAGGGYPQGLIGQEIHPFARVVAICDTYDAMTTQRTYNKPLSPRDALELMNGRLLKRFDPDMMKAMYSVLFRITKVA